MTYDDRMRLIAAWVGRFLSRFKCPEALSDAAAREEMNEIAETINSALPTNMNGEAMGERLKSLGKEINRKHKTRSWPLVSQFVDGLRATASTGGAVNDVEEFMLERCEDWHRKLGEPMPSCVNEGRAEALLRRGRCGTAREMYEAGYPLPQRIKDEMGGPTERAKRLHHEVMEALQATGYGLKAIPKVGEIS